MNEFVTGIRIVKYYGWESMAENKILTARDKEGVYIYKSALYRSFLEISIVLTPFIISISVFGTYIALGNVLTPSKAYTVLSLFNLLQVNLLLYIYLILKGTTSYVDVYICCFNFC
jgi:ATP-binding cassette subfamily C (CFTR/MRP) protein 4